MRLLIIAIIFSFNLYAKSSEEVVKEYLSYIQDPKEDKIEKLFSKEYIKNLGGKTELHKLIKTSKNKKREMAVKKVGSSKNGDFVEISSGKHKTTFILKKEDGIFKIDGNIKAE